MSYIKDMLLPGEKIVLKAEASRIAYLNAIMLLAVMMHPIQLMRLARTELALTDRRILGATGIGRRTPLALALKDVEGITVQRGILGWMFDYGTITISGKGDKRVVFKGIVWPLVFQQEAQEAVEVAVLGHKLSDFVPPI